MEELNPTIIYLALALLLLLRIFSFHLQISIMNQNDQVLALAKRLDDATTAIAGHVVKIGTGVQEVASDLTSLRNQLANAGVDGASLAELDRIAGNAEAQSAALAAQAELLEQTGKDPEAETGDEVTSGG